MTGPSLLVALTVVALVALVGERANGLLRPPARRPSSEGVVTARSWWPRPSRTPTAGNVAVADWSEQIARAVRTGSSLATAVEAATAECPLMASAAGPVVHAVRRGRPLAEAVMLLDGIGTDHGVDVDALRLVRPVLHTCAVMGGPAAPALKRVAVTLRMRAAIADEQLAQSAQARLSARVLTVVPVGLLVVLVVVDPAVRAAVATPAGSGLVLAGATTNGVGWWWMRRIIGVTP